jgi:hypothetical protein
MFCVVAAMEGSAFVGHGVNRRARTPPPAPVSVHLSKAKGLTLHRTVRFAPGLMELTEHKCPRPVARRSSLKLCPRPQHQRWRDRPHTSRTAAASSDDVLQQQFLAFPVRRSFVPRIWRAFARQAHDQLPHRPVAIENLVQLSAVFGLRWRRFDVTVEQRVLQRLCRFRAWSSMRIAPRVRQPSATGPVSTGLSVTVQSLASNAASRCARS